MNRYHEGKIYKLCNDVDDNIYVGSTCLSLAKRYYNHKKGARKLNSTSRVYTHLNTIGWENVHIILVESYPCENKMELLKRERYWIETLKSSLNHNIPTRTKSEYHRSDQYKEHLDKYRSSDKYKRNQIVYGIKYRQTDERKEYMKKYTIEYSEKNKESRRQYQLRRYQKQKFNKTLGYMESTIKKCQLELPVETSIIDSKNWNLSDRISYDLN